MILNVSTIEWTFTPWMRFTLLHDTVVKWAKAKVHVYSDSVLCPGEIYEHAEANAKWKDQLQYFQPSNKFKDLCGIDGEPLEFEWHIFPGHTTLENSPRDSRRTGSLPSTSRDLKIESSSCRCTTMLIGQKKGHATECFFRNSEQVRKYAKKISAFTLAVPRPRRRRTMVRNAHRQGSFS